MRDPKRIDSMLNALREAWEKHPDMRLGQLIENVKPAYTSTFYVDDSTLMARLGLLCDAGWDEVLRSDGKVKR